MKFIELSHTVVNGMVTFPGDPPVVIDNFLSREAATEKFGEKAAALLDRINMINTSGTYLDAPVHRFEGGDYICDIPLEKLVDLPVETVLLKSGKRCFEQDDLAHIGHKGGSVLLCTGHSEKFGTPDYGVDAPYLSIAGAQDLIDKGAIFIGIDTPLIDQMGSDACPVHDIILGAGGVVCEDMTNLRATLGLKNALLTAVPPKVHMASFTARVFVKTLE